MHQQLGEENRRPAEVQHHQIRSAEVDPLRCALQELTQCIHAELDSC
jgi:hypothetical protein